MLMFVKKCFIYIIFQVKKNILLSGEGTLKEHLSTQILIKEQSSYKAESRNKSDMGT